MKKTNSKQLIMFLLSAVAMGIVYIGVLFVCRTLLNIRPLGAVSIAYVVAMAFYFVTNKMIVFKKTGSGSVWRELFGFLPLAAVNYLLTLIIVAFIRRYTHEEYSGSFVAGIVTTALAYFVFEKLLFKK
jgi:putative flippase GtrA